LKAQKKLKYKGIRGTFLLAGVQACTSRMYCLPCWCSRNAQSGNHLQEHLRVFCCNIQLILLYYVVNHLDILYILGWLVCAVVILYLY